MDLDRDTQEAQERLRDRRGQYGLPDPAERPQEASSPRLLASVLPLRPVDPAELARIRATQLAAEARRQRAEREEMHRERARALGLPAHGPTLEAAVSDEPRETAALAAARTALRWRARRRVGQVLILAGPPGTGKSTAAAWAILRQGSGGVWESASELGASVRTSHSESLATWRRWERTHTLAIDDLGTETGDPATVCDLLSRRYDGGGLTIVTTNLPREVFRTRYLGVDGGRLLSRLDGQRLAGCPAWCDTGAVDLRREGAR